MVSKDESYLTTQLMSSGSTTEAEVDTRPQNNIFSDVMLHYFGIFVFIVAGSVIAVFGIVSNVINVIVYYKQGVKDSVTVTCIALSLWDFCNCFTTLLTVVCFVIENHFPIVSVDFLAISYVVLGYTRGCVYVLSTMVTMYLSVERCICIIIPFKVKQLFTKSRSIYINVVIGVLGCAFFCPYWATQGLQWTFYDKFNHTRLGLWVSDKRRDVNVFWDLFNGVVILTTTQVVVTISAGFMISGIKTSSRFRHKSAGISAVKEGQYDKQDTLSSETNEKSKTKDKVLSSKDLRWTKVVVIVAIIFFICNLPPLLLQVARAVVIELDINKTYSNLHYVANIIVNDFGLINSSSTIFVYYSVSTKFKEVFFSLFSNTKMPGRRELPNTLSVVNVLPTDNLRHKHFS